MSIIPVNKVVLRIIQFFHQVAPTSINRLRPNDPYMSRTAPLTSKFCILYIYSTNVCTEYSKHALNSRFFSLQNAVCFIMLTCLVPVLFTFYIQDVLKSKENNSGAKGLIRRFLELSNFFIMWLLHPWTSFPVFVQSGRKITINCMKQIPSYAGRNSAD